MSAEATTLPDPQAAPEGQAILRTLFELRPAALRGEGEGPLPDVVPRRDPAEDVAPPLAVAPAPWLVTFPASAVRMISLGTIASTLLHAALAVAAAWLIDQHLPAPMELPAVDIEIVAPAEPPPAAPAAAAAEEPKPQETPTPEPEAQRPERETAEAPPQEAPPQPAPEPVRETPQIELEPPPPVDLALPTELLPPPPKPPEPPRPEVARRPEPRPQPRVTAAPPRREPPREVRRAERPTAPRSSQASSASSAGRGVASDQSQRTSTPPPSYLARVIAQLHRAKPAGNGEQGRAVVRFAIQRSGAATSVALAQSSGHAAIDQAATAMVRRASPFPPLPAEFGPATMALTVPIQFR